MHISFKFRAAIICRNIYKQEKQYGPESLARDDLVTNNQLFCSIKVSQGKIS